MLIVITSAGLTCCKSGSAEAYFLERAKKLMEQKQYDRAIIELKNAARLDPKSADPYYQAGLAYLAMGDYRAAYRNLIHATEIDPGHTAAQLKVAELIGSRVAGTRDPQVLKEAEQRVQSVLAIMPENADVLSTIGLTEYLLGKPDDAVKHLEVALEKFPQQLQAARTLAVIRLDQKDFSGAEQILKNAVVASPNSPEAQLALARFYRVDGRIPDAEIACRRALSIDPKYGPALLDLAQLQLSSGRKEDAEKSLAALAALPDKQYRPLHAIFLFEQGKHDEALKEFEQQAQADPNDQEAFQRLTSAYFFTKRFPDAEKVINAALKKNPKNGDALIAQVRLYIITARFSEAEVDLDQFLRFQPASATAHYLLSKVHQARGEQSLRLDQLGQAVRLDPNLLRARVELAEAFIAARAAKAALEILDQTPQKQAQMLPVIVQRNWALLNVDDRVEARKNLDRALALYKNAPDLWLQDGLLRLQNKDLVGARKSLELVLAARPQDVAAVDALAKTYVIQNQKELAIQTVQRWAGQQPHSAPLQSLLGQWLEANKRFDEARTAFDAAFAADPGFLAARISVGYLDIEQGKFEAAKQILDSVPRTPATRTACEVGLAQVEERVGNPVAAIPHYRKALESDPNNVSALNGLAYDLANATDQLDEALKYAQQAMELAPNNLHVEDTIGWAYYRKGLYRGAVEYLGNAVAQGGMAVPKYHLAMAYLKTGDAQRARLLLQQARNADPNLPEAAAAQKVLAELSAKNN